MSLKLTPEERTTQVAYSTIAEKWDRTYTCKRWKDDNWVRFTSHVKPGGRIIDLGCGTTHPEAELITSEGFEYVGIDLSKKMLEVAKRNLAARRIAGRVARMDMRELTFDDETFDGFVSVTSFMHLPRASLPQALNEARRVLRKDGAGLISISRGTFEGLYAPKKNSPQMYVVCWQQEDFDRALCNAGLSICSCIALDHMLIYVVGKS